MSRDQKMALSAGEEPTAENFIEDPVESSPEVPAEVTPAGSSSAFGRMLHWNAARTAQRRRAGELETRRSRRKRSSWRFILPSLIGVSVFFLVPFLVVVYYSLVNNPVQHVFVGADNYMRILQNPAFLTAARNTLVFSMISVPLAVVLSLLLAVVLESRIPFKSYFRSFFLSPMMVPVASVILVWQVLFHSHGLANDMIGFFGLGPIDWPKSDYAMIPICILFLWKNLGYNMILFMAGLSAIPREILEVAKLESATDWQIFWSIKLRYLSSSIMFVTIMSLINSFKVFREIYLLTGDHPYGSLYMLQHFINNNLSSLDYQKVSSAAIIMSVVMVGIIALLLLAENQAGRDLES